MIGTGDTPDTQKGQSGIVRAALSGLCPKCGARTLFEGAARIAFKCDNCGLKIAELERGGRLAGLVTIIVALILIGAALAIESAYRPPLWLQGLFWGPVTVLSVIAVLRLYKTALLFRQYEIVQEQGE